MSYGRETKEALAKREQEEQKRAAEWSIARDFARALGAGELPEQPSPLSGHVVNRIRSVLKEEAARIARVSAVAAANPPAAQPRWSSIASRSF